MTAPAILQSASGGGGAGTTTVTVSLDTPADAGHSVVIVYFAAVAVSAHPASLADDLVIGAGAKLYFWREDLTAGGEQTWDITHVAAGIAGVWAVAETDPLDTISPLAAATGTSDFHPATSVSTLSTGTTATTDTNEPLVLAAHVFYNGNFSGTFATWASQTNGFTEIEESFTTVTAGFYDLALSWAQPGTTGGYESTATFSTDETRSAANDTFMAGIAAYRALNEVVIDPNILVGG